VQKSQISYDYILDFISARIRRTIRTDESAIATSLEIDEIGIDSLELTEIIMELEDNFAVTIDDSQLSGSTTISELALHIEKLIRC